jgi:hypothetical protein
MFINKSRMMVAALLHINTFMALTKRHKINNSKIHILEKPVYPLSNDDVLQIVRLVICIMCCPVTSFCQSWPFVILNNVTYLQSPLCFGIIVKYSWKYVYSFKNKQLKITKNSSNRKICCGVIHNLNVINNVFGKLNRAKNLAVHMLPTLTSY